MVFFCLYQMAEKAEGRLGFLLTAYAAPILPWMGISRYSFLYHYYPSIPFLALLIGYWAEKRGRWGKCCLGLCVLASAVCFCLFYPVISALRVPQGYVAGWLEWLPGWDFIS